MDTSDNKQLRWLQDALTARRLSRREFVGRAMALGATASLATTLAGKAVRAAEPRRGGRLRIALAHGATSDSLDPGNLPNAFQVAVSEAISNTLTAVTPDRALVRGNSVNRTGAIPWTPQVLFPGPSPFVTG